MSAISLGTYRQVETTTADPARLVVMLYDGAIRALRTARRAVERNHHATFVAEIGRANAIVGELSATLDRAAGGDIAANLDRLYAFVLGRLTQAMIDRSPRPIDDALPVLQALREAFGEAAEIAGGAKR